MKLAMILGDLKNLNKDAIYPITFILQPYIGQNELNLLIPPVSTREAIANDADSGKAEFEHTDGQG